MTEVAEALALLTSAAPLDRIKGARYLSKHKAPENLHKLKGCLQGERVGHVRTALENAVAFQSNVTPEPALGEGLKYTGDEVSSSAELKKQMYSDAVNEVAGMLLHELEPKIGLLKVAARKEVNEYEASDVKKHLESLNRCFIGIADLRRASSTPRAVQFDLAQTIKDNVEEQSGGLNEVFLYHGPQPFLIISDQNLLTLGITNGIKNAIEAVEQIEDSENRRIVIDWGNTDVDYWLTILDNGPGLVGSTEAAFGIGKTNKPGHSGFGLAVVREVMANLDGNAIIEPGRNGGAILRFRWAKAL